jgi:hypothetical protein
MVPNFKPKKEVIEILDELEQLGLLTWRNEDDEAVILK